MANEAFTFSGKSAWLLFAGGDSPIGENQDGFEKPPEVSVALQCAAADRYAIFQGLMGYSTGGPGAIVRVLPAAYPPSPNLYCTGVTGAKLIGYKGAWDFKRCQFTAKFGRLTYDISGTSGDPSGKLWTTTRSRVSAEVTQVALGTFVWTAGVDSGKPVPESKLGILAPRVEFSITRHVMPYAPIDECLVHIGNLNSTTVKIGNRTFPIGHLLFLGANITESVDAAFNRAYEVDYSVLGADHDWNALLDRGAVYRIVNTIADASGIYPFGYSDFWAGLP